MIPTRREDSHAKARPTSCTKRNEHLYGLPVVAKQEPRLILDPPDSRRRSVDPVSDDPAQQPRMRRCLELFEDCCIVTQSARQGINDDVEVEPAGGPAVP